MKVIMIGTPVCTKCKRISPVIEEYCSNHSIEFQYLNLGELPKEYMELLVSKNVKQAPAFLIYRGQDIIVVSGDDIFLELETL